VAVVNIECEVTRYRVVGDEVVETTKTEVTTFEVDRHPHGMLNRRYLYLHNSQASAPLEGLRGFVAEGRGWCAQAGTKPVKIECQVDGRYMECCGPGGCQAGWGGRNYPRIYVTHDALERALGEVESCTTR
jgi:hypothetical protein